MPTTPGKITMKLIAEFANGKQADVGTVEVDLVAGVTEFVTALEPAEQEGVNRFRKKPVEIQAMRWTGMEFNTSDVIDWVLSSGGTARYVDYDPEYSEHIDIDTLEGTMRADPGDWIIRGVAGEFYACKPDIFGATYELVDVTDHG